MACSKSKCVFCRIYYKRSIITKFVLNNILVHENMGTLRCESVCVHASVYCTLYMYRYRHIYLISLFHFIIGYSAYWRLVGNTLLRFGPLIKLFFWQFHFQCGALHINDLYKDTNTQTRAHIHAHAYIYIYVQYARHKKITHFTK